MEKLAGYKLKSAVAPCGFRQVGTRGGGVEGTVSDAATLSQSTYFNLEQECNVWFWISRNTAQTHAEHLKNKLCPTLKKYAHVYR